MKNIYKPDERLSMLSDMVRQSSRVLDVGTDHAYLPVYLVHSGKCPSAVASDVKKGPLANARETVALCDMQSKISLYLSDGLDGVPENCADDIVIAGMGGNLIAEIVGRCEWLKNKNIRLVLQPMTHVEDVRRCLFENGFEIVEENTCFCDGRVYLALSAEYTGQIQLHDEKVWYVGRLDKTVRDKESALVFLRKNLGRIRQRIDALTAARPDSDEIPSLTKAETAIKDAIGELKK